MKSDKNATLTFCDMTKNTAGQPFNELMPG